MLFSSNKQKNRKDKIETTHLQNIQMKVKLMRILSFNPPHHGTSCRPTIPPTHRTFNLPENTWILTSPHRKPSRLTFPKMSDEYNPEQLHSREYASRRHYATCLQMKSATPKNGTFTIS